MAYSKGVEVCSTATAPIAPLPYVSCVKEVADVLEQWVRISISLITVSGFEHDGLFCFITLHEELIREVDRRCHWEKCGLANMKVVSIDNRYWDAACQMKSA